MKENINGVKPTVVSPIEVISFKFIETHQDIECLLYWSGKTIKTPNDLQKKKKELIPHFSW